MKKARKILVALLTAALIISNFASSMISAMADTVTSINYVEAVDDIIGIPGETVHVKLPVRSNGGFIANPKISVVTDDLPFTVGKITYTADGYTAENPPTGISDHVTTYIEFDIKVKETAPISRNKIQVNIEYAKNVFNDDGTTVAQDTLTLPNAYLVINSEIEPAQLTVDNIIFDNAIIGNETELSFMVKNEGEMTSHNTYFSISDYAAAGMAPNYSKLKQEIGQDGQLAPSESFRVKLPVTILPNATAGSKTLTVKMEYKNGDGTPFTIDNIIYIKIDDNILSPKVEIDSTKYASELKAGDEFNLVTTLRNTGLSTASEVEVKVGGLGIESFLPNYTTETIATSDLEHNKKVDVKIPLIVSKSAAIGLKEIPVIISYKDEAGVALTTETTLYLEIVSGNGVDSSGKPNIVVSNVNQSPDQPNAGARVDISFDLENKSNVDISEVKISLSNVTGTNFSPVNSEPYQYINKLQGGKKIRVNIPLSIADTILEGTSNLEIKYDYKDESGKIWSDIATIYVLDIQSDGAAASKPKLIISNFTTDIEELRAGSTFKFLFDIKNTHSNVDAQNIKVTVSQVENIFSVAEGSNTLYITEIPAGETVQNTLELKVKSDAVTKAYPVEITIEYDYNGAEVNPETGEINDIEVKETINLQAVENARPVVNNIYVGSYDLPSVNQPTALTFEFYNMGKSTLNNVYATVEGDYTLSTGSMYFIGNVESGYSEYAELEVIPTLEGLAKGNLVITFEDSNGDEVKVTKEFESTVQGEMIPTFPEDGMNGDMGMIETPVKQPILPIWLFVIVQLVILGVGIPVTRKVLLGLYRRKLRKQEEAE